MRTKVSLGVVGALALVAATASLADPAQDRPGIITQARVLVENRTAAEAVPVTLQDVATTRPLRVQMDGAVVVVRLASQAWEYRTLAVRSGEDPAMALATLGEQGWEATGVQLPGNGVVNVLLKRPVQR
jgi:hypothetical protein